MIFELPRDILIHGVYSTRKTAQAMTASKFYPALPALPPFKTSVKLTDVGILAWDSQPTLSFPHLGMELAPENIFHTTGRLVPASDNPNELEPESIVSLIAASRAWGIKLAKAGVKYFVHDSLSAKDTKNVSFWTKRIDDGKEGNDGAGQKLYRNVLKTHSMDLEWWQNLAAHYDCYNIWIAHTAIKGQASVSDKVSAVKATELERQAKGLTGPELGARITGASWSYFYEQCRAVYYQSLETEFGKVTAKWTTRSNEVAVKPGFPAGVLPDKINADFRELFKIARGEK